jgi:hypothetical protein
MLPATVGPFKPEPVIDEGDYQHVLGVIEGMVKVEIDATRVDHPFFVRSMACRADRRRDPLPISTASTQHRRPAPATRRMRH